MTDPLKHRASVIESLGSSLRRGGASLGTVPGLLKRVLQEEAWREFETSRGDVVRHERFSDFVATPPLKGLGASMELIDRIVGTDDPDLLRMLREAKKVGQGRRSDLSLPDESTGSVARDRDAEDAERLAREAPDEYEAVKRGEKTIHAAAVAAGIRKRRISIRLDDPTSAIRSIRNNASPEFWQEFRRLVNE
ncbi:MAG UNVERIFIED_CONTAM: hypothetical protein LOD86_08665 [Thermobifida fusca]